MYGPSEWKVRFPHLQRNALRKYINLTKQFHPRECIFRIWPLSKVDWCILLRMCLIWLNFGVRSSYKYPFWLMFLIQGSNDSSIPVLRQFHSTLTELCYIYVFKITIEIVAYFHGDVLAHTIFFYVAVNYSHTTICLVWVFSLLGEDWLNATDSISKES